MQKQGRDQQGQRRVPPHPRKCTPHWCQPSLDRLRETQASAQAPRALSSAAVGPRPDPKSRANGQPLAPNTRAWPEWQVGLSRGACQDMARNRARGPAEGKGPTWAHMTTPQQKLHLQRRSPDAGSGGGAGRGGVTLPCLSPRRQGHHLLPTRPSVESTPGGTAGAGSPGKSECGRLTWAPAASEPGSELPPNKKELKAEVTPAEPPFCPGWRIPSCHGAQWSARRCFLGGWSFIKCGPRAAGAERGPSLGFAGMGF